MKKAATVDGLKKAGSLTLAAIKALKSFANFDAVEPLSEAPEQRQPNDFTFTPPQSTRASHQERSSWSIEFI